MQLVPFQVALKRLETSTDCTTVTNLEVRSNPFGRTVSSMYSADVSSLKPASHRLLRFCSEIEVDGVARASQRFRVAPWRDMQPGIANVTSEALK